MGYTRRLSEDTEKRAPPNEIDGENQLLIFALRERERARGGTHRTTRGVFYPLHLFSLEPHEEKVEKDLFPDLPLYPHLTPALDGDLSPLSFSE